MSEVRDYLSRTLAKKVEVHGIVVWEDPNREYDNAAESVAPPRTSFVRWNGSWYKLRRELEGLVPAQLLQRS